MGDVRTERGDLHEIKKWLYPQLCRFNSERQSYFCDIIAGSYKEYEAITARPPGTPVEFVDDSLLNFITFERLCEFIQSYSASWQARAEQAEKDRADAIKAAEIFAGQRRSAEARAEQAEADASLSILRSAMRRIQRIASGAEEGPEGHDEHDAIVLIDKLAQAALAGKGDEDGRL